MKEEAEGFQPQDDDAGDNPIDDFLSLKIDGNKDRRIFVNATIH